MTNMERIELFNDHFQNFKVYGIPKAQLIIADVPYNLGNNAYASNPKWYKDGDNRNGESELAGKQFFGCITPSLRHALMERLSRWARKSDTTSTMTSSPTMSLIGRR